MLCAEPSLAPSLGNDILLRTESAELLGARAVPSAGDTGAVQLGSGVLTLAGVVQRTQGLETENQRARSNSITY